MGHFRSDDRERAMVRETYLFAFTFLLLPLVAAVAGSLAGSPLTGALAVALALALAWAFWADRLRRKVARARARRQSMNSHPTNAYLFPCTPNTPVPVPVHTEAAQ